MLTRRALFKTASALCVSMANLKRVSAAGPKPNTTVAFDVPRGACDAHVHVVGERKEFTMSPERDYTPPAATADDLVEMLKFLNIERAVIVTPTVYGNDNSVTLAAIEKLGRDRARGVALVDETTSSERLDSMMKGGITGIRLFLGGGVFRPAAAAKHLQTAIDLANVRGWHLDISAPPDVVAALAPQLAACPVPVVLGYFGWVAGGVQQPGFEAVLSLVKSVDPCRWSIQHGSRAQPSGRHRASPQSVREVGAQRGDPSHHPGGEPCSALRVLETRNVARQPLRRMRVLPPRADDHRNRFRSR